ncbi:hypothetical protein ACFWBF_11255 [Streptomyces sp. NPDC060028]|uniref:hypothetical protein n=1 Tax=Streptomyces sp. NPDC060028 TaxID=3347041 RepID=UPI0036914D67
MLERKQLKDRTQVTFVLPAETPPGPLLISGNGPSWRSLGRIGPGMVRISVHPHEVAAANNRDLEQGAGPEAGFEAVVGRTGRGGTSRNGVQGRIFNVA